MSGLVAKLACWRVRTTVRTYTDVSNPLAEVVGMGLGQPRCDERKFSELVLYVGAKMKDDPNYGATILNKILWDADFMHYRDFGTPITGAEYVKMPFGPAPRMLPRIREALIARGRARLEMATVGPSGKRQERLIPADGVNADMSRFEASELAAADRAIKEYGGLTATAASNKAHDFIGWAIADDDEVIPYQSVLLMKPEITDDDLDAARRVAKEIATARA